MIPRHRFTLSLPLFVLAVLMTSIASAQVRDEYPKPAEAEVKAGTPQGKLEGPFEFRSRSFQERSENTGSTFPLNTTWRNHRAS